MTTETALVGHERVLNRLLALYEDLFAHDGFGEIRVEIRLLKRGQKEVILHCGKQHRYVVDYGDQRPARMGAWRVVEASRLASDRRQRRMPIEFPDRRMVNSQS
jgi:hypothetical protein